MLSGQEEEEADEQVPRQPASSIRPDSVPTAAEAGPSSSRASHNASLDELVGISQYQGMRPVLKMQLDSLPHTISYTPFTHPCLSSPLLRRDLFDARFQLISQDAADRKEKGKDKVEDDYVDAKSDLIPGLYEGGLKTWEGGVDLVEVLSDGVKAQAREGLLRGKSVLEVSLRLEHSCEWDYLLTYRSGAGRLYPPPSSLTTSCPAHQTRPAQPHCICKITTSSSYSSSRFQTSSWQRSLTSLPNHCTQQKTHPTSKPSCRTSTPPGTSA